MVHCKADGQRFNGLKQPCHLEILEVNNTGPWGLVSLQGFIWCHIPSPQGQLRLSCKSWLTGGVIIMENLCTNLPDGTVSPTRPPYKPWLASWSHAPTCMLLCHQADLQTMTGCTWYHWEIHQPAWCKNIGFNVSMVASCYQVHHFTWMVS